MRKVGLLLISLLTLASCASIDFGGEGLTYYDPIPYLFVSVTNECVSTATVVSIPGQKRKMKFKTGYGSYDLSASLSNGMIVAVGQKSEAKIPESLTSIAALKTAGILSSTGEPNQSTGCDPVSVMYPINDGIPDVSKPINLVK